VSERISLLQAVESQNEAFSVVKAEDMFVDIVCCSQSVCSNLLLLQRLAIYALHLSHRCAFHELNGASNNINIVTDILRNHNYNDIELLIQSNLSAAPTASKSVRPG
jgi:hypothetical protein